MLLIYLYDMTNWTNLLNNWMICNHICLQIYRPNHPSALSFLVPFCLVNVVPPPYNCGMEWWRLGPGAVITNSNEWTNLCFFYL